MMMVRINPSGKYVNTQSTQELEENEKKVYRTNLTFSTKKNKKRKKFMNQFLIDFKVSLFSLKMRIQN